MSAVPKIPVQKLSAHHSPYLALNLKLGRVLVQYQLQSLDVCVRPLLGDHHLLLQIELSLLPLQNQS